MLLESLLSNRKESGSEKYLPIWEIFEKLSDTELKAQPVNIDISNLGLSLLFKQYNMAEVFYILF